jgi:hypothetical protein
MCPSVTDSCWSIVKDGKHEDAEQCLGLYLDALDEELVELHTYISTHMPASAPGTEELEGEVQSAEGQTERDYTVRQLLFPSLCTELDVLRYAWT